MFRRFKKYIIGDAIRKTSNHFEKAKIAMFFNLTIMSVLFYTIGSIIFLSKGYWYIETMQLVGYILIIALVISIKKTNGYKVPALIWMSSIVFLSFFGAIINNGELSYLNLGLLLMNVPFMFLMSSKFWGYVNLIYAAAYIFVTLSISYSDLRMIDVGIDFSHDRKFFNEPNIIYILIPVALTIYIFYEFIAAEKKARIILSRQKGIALEHQDIIKTKNKSINDSIDYATQIQRTLLPELNDLDLIFKDYFLLFNPVDQLSGDFYWVNKIDNILYFAVIDSSESGVPGALISFICHNGLNTAINEVKLKTPAEILDYLEDYFKLALSKEKRKGEINIALCSFDTDQNLLTYAGENNSIYIINNNDLLEYRPKKYSPSKLDNRSRFKDQKTILELGDIIYIFSDGYANQYKGMQGEKLKQSVFKQLLLSIASKPMAGQKAQLQSNLKDWLGYDTQSDDICILGLKM